MKNKKKKRVRISKQNKKKKMRRERRARRERTRRERRNRRMRRERNRRERRKRRKRRPCHPKTSKPLVFVSNRMTGSETGTVSVIDPCDLSKPCAPIPVGTQPVGITIHDIPGKGLKVYVANFGDDNNPGSVSVIDVKTCTVDATIPTGGNPVYIAIGTIPEGDNAGKTLAYVTNISGNRVFIIDTADNSLLGEVPAGPNPNGVAITPSGDEIYVTNFVDDPGTCTVINTTDNMIVATIDLINPANGNNLRNPLLIDIADIPGTGTRAFIAMNGSSSLLIIDTVSKTVLRRRATAGPAPIGVRVSPDKSFLYLTDSEVLADNPSQVCIFGTGDNIAPISTIPFNQGGLPLQQRAEDIAFTSDGAKAFIPNSLTNNVSVIDVATSTVKTVVDVGEGPMGVAISPGNCNPSY
ncbi:hypothetical protein IC620_16765 [Hazenella sp. IB182357]|uniref:YncE family protein n=1 Tax=Polycladospora coralii TaxID=2771432 RepID=A0A926RVV5_9BACL|nr:hypothetical protein [Polycladospora coralii]MBD1373994.1 hypothetical protein [Polycladospora coralii]